MSEAYVNSKSWHGRPPSHRIRGEAGRGPVGASKLKAMPMRQRPQGSTTLMFSHHEVIMSPPNASTPLKATDPFART